MEVRRAERSDLLGIGRVLNEVLWATYGDFLPFPAAAEALSFAASPTELKRRMLDGGLFVAVDERRMVRGCGVVELGPETAMVRTIAVDESLRRLGIGHRLMEAMRGAAGGRPVSMRVFLGSLEAEHFAEREGFVPGEVLEGALGGHPVVERRWWFAPVAGAVGST